MYIPVKYLTIFGNSCENRKQNSSDLNIKNELVSRQNKIKDFFQLIRQKPLPCITEILQKH